MNLTEISLQTLDEHLRMLYAQYPRHPEQAEEIAKEIAQIEELIQMHNDVNNVYRIIGEVA